MTTAPVCHVHTRYVLASCPSCRAKLAARLAAPERDQLATVHQLHHRAA